MKLLDMILAWFARLWIRRCQHPSGAVTYDIREQAISDEEWPIKYCNRCGAVKAHPQPWRLPTP
jgi:hypothetical protein